MRLEAHQTALIVGIVAGLIFAFWRKGATSGDMTPFNGR